MFFYVCFVFLLSCVLYFAPSKMFLYVCLIVCFVCSISVLRLCFYRFYTSYYNYYTLLLHLHYNTLFQEWEVLLCFISCFVSTNPSYAILNFRLSLARQTIITASLTLTINARERTRELRALEQMEMLSCYNVFDRALNAPTMELLALPYLYMCFKI